MVKEPDIKLSAWIEPDGIRVQVTHNHTGYGYDCGFDRLYDKPGQLSAIIETFRRDLVQFVDEFRKKR